MTRVALTNRIRVISERRRCSPRTSK
jgi:hypothetical protein